MVRVDRPAFDPASAVFRAHEGGKLRVSSTMRLNDRAALSIAYTPGVAEVCTAIAREPALARDYTWAPRLVAVVSDGTAVLGLGDIGPAASLPVMEGKCALFAEFAGLSAVPIVLSTDRPGRDRRDGHGHRAVVRRHQPRGHLGAPRASRSRTDCAPRLPIPVFHDDQHGTAIVVLAALRNAALLTGRTLADLRVVVSGAGAAGVACTKILLAAGIGDIAVCDSRGVVHAGRTDLNIAKTELAAADQPGGLTGSLDDALRGADVFLGLSAGRVPETVVATMAPGAIIFALANPEPEVARRRGPPVRRRRGDRPQRLPQPDQQRPGLPGVFAGAFDAGARAITEGMKLAAAAAIGEVVADDLAPDLIVPTPFDPRVAPAVAAAVAAQAVVDGVVGVLPRSLT